MQTLTERAAKQARGGSRKESDPFVCDEGIDCHYCNGPETD